MPVYEGSHQGTLPAPPDLAFAVMTDYETLPQWQRSLKRCAVLDRYDEGLGRDVEYEVDVKLRTVTYRLRHSYEPPLRIASEYLGGDFAHFTGSWSFAPSGTGGSHAQLAVAIDPGFAVPRSLARMLNNRVLKSSVDDLRKRLESS